MRLGMTREGKAPRGSLLEEAPAAALSGRGPASALGEHEALVELLDALVELGDLLLGFAVDPVGVGLESLVLVLGIVQDLVAALDHSTLIAQLHHVLVDLLVLLGEAQLP